MLDKFLNSSYWTKLILCLSFYVFIITAVILFIKLMTLSVADLFYSMYFYINILILGSLDILLGFAMAYGINHYIRHDNNDKKSIGILSLCVLLSLFVFKPDRRYDSDVIMQYRYLEGQEVTLMRYASILYNIKKHSSKEENKQHEMQDYYILHNIISNIDDMGKWSAPGTIPYDKGYEFFRTAYQTCMPYAEHEEPKNKSGKIDECLKQYNWLSAPQIDKASSSDYFKMLHIMTQPYVLSHIVFNGQTEDYFLNKGFIAKLWKDNK